MTTLTVLAAAIRRGELSPREAVQDALDKSAAMAEEKMGALTGGLKIPGLM